MTMEQMQALQMQQKGQMGMPQQQTGMPQQGMQQMPGMMPQQMMGGMQQQGMAPLPGVMQPPPTAGPSMSMAAKLHAKAAKAKANVPPLQLDEDVMSGPPPPLDPEPEPEPESQDERSSKKDKKKDKKGKKGASTGDEYVPVMEPVYEIGASM